MSNVVTRANSALDDDKSKSDPKDAKKKDEREKSGTPKESVAGTPAKSSGGAAAKLAANGGSTPRQGSPARVKPTTSQDKKDEKKDKKDDKKEKKDDKKEKKDDKKDKKDDKKEEKKNDKDKETAKSKNEKVQNGDSGVRNGVADVALNRNGVGGGVESNGLNGHSMGPGGDDIEEECVGAGAEHNDDELFPELNYDEDDVELVEGEGEGEERGDVAHVDRSVTRRSQVKQTRTPETPQPATKQTEKELANGEEKKQDSNTEGGKVLKLKDDVTSRKLRSAGGVADVSETADSSCIVLDDDDDDDEEETVAGAGAGVERVKLDTNYARCRAKVSPYRRSARLHASNMADYTGNNSTMEMDFTASFEGGAGAGVEGAEGEGAAVEWGVSSLRGVRARRSYKLLPDLDMSALSYTRHRNTSTTTSTSESTSRPTGHVVGRKRKTEIGDDVINDKCRGGVSGAGVEGAGEEGAGVKRMRLLERVVSPWWRRRSLVPASTPLPQRRHHAIVGVNSDLPLHGSLSVEAPVAAAAVAETAAESLKGAALADGAQLPATSVPVELAVEAGEAEEARNRCSIQ